MSEIFIQTFFLYFIVIDPLGNTPLFLSITQNMDTNKKIGVALSATIIAFNYITIFCITWKLITKLFKYFLSSFYNWRRNNFINNCN
jgi:small neutral amino acid transporter SnatA (MarC family)